MPMKFKMKHNRKRSPNHPCVSLKKAIELVRQIYEENKTHMVPNSVAYKTWGYSAGSSMGHQCVGALKSYGLIHASTKLTDGNRQIQVSPRARRIVTRAPGAPDALRRAALAPQIHKELWDKYNCDLPSDDVIRHYLLFDREEGCFNDDSVDAFIARFRETLDVAGLAGGSIIKEDSDPREAEEATGLSMQLHAGQGDPGHHAAGAFQMPHETKQDVFTLGKGKAVLQWPAHLDETGFEDLKDWLELVLRKISRSVTSNQTRTSLKDPEAEG